MDFDYGVKLTKIVSTQSERLCKLYIEYLNNDGFKIHYDSSLSVKENCNNINMKIKNLSNSNERADRTVSTMYSKVHSSFIDDSELAWIIDCNYSCFLAWSFITNELSEGNIKKNSLIDIGIKDKSLESFLACTHNKERYRSIINFIDHYDFSFDEKKELIKKIRSVISSNTYLIDKLKFIKEDSVSIHWAWNYIAESGYSLPFINPDNEEYKLLAAISFFSTWNADTSRKELFLIKMKGAWRQKKLRINNKDNKLINTYISKESKKMLDRLMDEKEVTMKKVLEWAIRSEYNKIFNEK